jgi:hypothetical protein
MSGLDAYKPPEAEQPSVPSKAREYGETPEKSPKEKLDALIAKELDEPATKCREAKNIQDANKAVDEGLAHLNQVLAEADINVGFQTYEAIFTWESSPPAKPLGFVYDVRIEKMGGKLQASKVVSVTYNEYGMP